MIPTLWFSRDFRALENCQWCEKGKGLGEHSQCFRTERPGCMVVYGEPMWLPMCSAIGCTIISSTKGHDWLAWAWPIINTQQEEATGRDRQISKVRFPGRTFNLQSSWSFLKLCWPVQELSRANRKSLTGQLDVLVGFGIYVKEVIDSRDWEQHTYEESSYMLEKSGRIAFRLKLPKLGLKTMKLFFFVESVIISFIFYPNNNVFVFKEISAKR